jgi:hypothetical protein
MLGGGTVGRAHAMRVDAGDLQAAVTHAFANGRGGNHRSKLGRREGAQPMQGVVVAETSGEFPNRLPIVSRRTGVPAGRRSGPG